VFFIEKIANMTDSGQRRLSRAKDGARGAVRPSRAWGIAAGRQCAWHGKRKGAGGGVVELHG
jgi:hypothetical protein